MVICRSLHPAVAYAVIDVYSGGCVELAGYDGPLSKVLCMLGIFSLVVVGSRLVSLL